MDRNLLHFDFDLQTQQLDLKLIECFIKISNFEFYDRFINVIF